MPPNHFESEVESFLEGSHGDRTHIKRADHHTVTPLCGTLLKKFALRAHNTPNSAFLCLLGEYFAEVPLWGPCWASFFAPTDIVPALVGDTAPYKSEVVGVLHYMKPSYSVSPACRTLMSCNSPRCSVPHPVLCVHGVCLVC